MKFWTGMFCFIFGSIMAAYILLYIYHYKRFNNFNKNIFAYAIFAGYLLLALLGIFITII